MPLVTNRQPGEVIPSADHNDVALEVNTHTGRIDEIEGRGFGVPGQQEGTAEAPTVTTIWEFQVADPARGPFRQVVGGALNSDFGGPPNDGYDYVLYGGWAYNMAAGGLSSKADEPMVGAVTETFYEHDGGGGLTRDDIEAYVAWYSPNPLGTGNFTNGSPNIAAGAVTAPGRFEVGQLIRGTGIPDGTKVATINGAGVPLTMSKNYTGATANGVAFYSAGGIVNRSYGRPLFWRFERNTGDIIGWEISSKGVSFADWDDNSKLHGTLGRTGLTLGGFLDNNVTIAIESTATTNTSFYMEYHAATAFSMTPNSASNVPISINGNGTLWLFDRTLGLGMEDTSGALVAKHWNGGDVFVARENGAGQTGQFFAARSPDGSATYWRIGPLGDMVIAKSTAMPDAYLSAGEMAIWFDKTNGAAKMMVKAKQADGTVRTGQLALA